MKFRLREKFTSKIFCRRKYPDLRYYTHDSNISYNSKVRSEEMINSTLLRLSCGIKKIIIIACILLTACTYSYVQTCPNHSSYLEPSVRAQLAFLGKPLAVAGRNHLEVRVLDHLGNAGLGRRQFISEVIELPSQAEQQMHE